ncbi:serine/threonine-protein phosphatase 6 regulatory ankyrin repeat subunit B-like [Haliotis rufescens]|uniref:serine/threonine-protein phosphatase 6 regulatory ankyrin repeat subunit B-like n=1 Tax=Haliotis rufescens TaxID=6454 RepID=UPI00201E8D59|nr:serine/threonine-protein phosphatase 6 regulatory ankyrin repeat subunit B-like [Haliotis rufescens]
MASTDEDCGHHLVMATSGEQSKGHMATSGEQSEGQMATSGEQSEGHMATSGEQSEGHMDTSEPQGHLAISDVDMASSAGEIFTTEDDSGNSVVSSDEEPQGHLVLADSAETEEDLEPVSQPPVKRLRTGDHPSGGFQVANTLNIITGQAGQGTLGRGTLDLRTDEAKKIFLATEPYKDVKRKLKEFGHVTICGASGEGKTTMALVLGSQYRDKGYEVVFVDNIEKFDLDQCLSSHPRVFLIVDDMFGTVGLSANTSQVKTFLNNLPLHLEQKRSAEKLQSEMHESSDAVGKSRKKVQIQPEFQTKDSDAVGKSRKKVQSQPEFQTKDSDAVGKSRKKLQSQPEFQTKDIRVVFTSKSYNFHDGLAKLQYEGFKLFKGQTVMDLTTQDKYWLSDKEKKTIFERHRKALGDCSMQHIPDYSELEICSNIFGFPLICKLCFEFSSFYKNAKSFFKEPLFYLRLELKRLLEERNDRSAILVLMLLCEDKLDLSKLDSGGEDKEMDSLVKTVLQMMSDATRSGMYKAAKGLRGTFFTRGDTVGFAHSSIYDACACALYNISPIFVLKHCSDDFLFERVQGDKVEETKVDDYLHLIYVSENYDDLLTTRFTQSIKQGQFSKSVTHPILKQDATVFKLLKKLHCDRTKHLWFHKKEKGQCLLYWAVLGHNARLFTDIEHTTGEEFTQGEISEAMEGCAQSNKVTALKWLFSRSEKHDHQLTLNRLLLVAAESGSSDILVYLLQEGADINTRDKGMQNIFHLVCKSGMEKTLKVLLTRKPGENVINSVDVNGKTPVMVAAHTGSEGCFKLLQTSNLNVKDKHGSGIIHLACRGGNTAIVQHVMSPSNINSRGEYGWTSVMLAAVTGHQSVFDLLVSNQADLTLVDTDGDSLLHLACRGGNTAIVQHVMSPSNINSRGEYGWTSVMLAAVTGHQSVFDLLVSNQADLTLVDTDGDSLLHLACRGGNTAIVQHVMSQSNINSRGEYGRTAAMRAAVSGHQSVFDLLVSNQADLTLVDADGDSLLHLPCHGGNTAIVKHVLTPSNINSRGEYGRTAAMRAAVSGHQSVFDLLVSNQADLTLVDADGDSLLHLACEGGNTAIVKHVLSPSNINSRGRHGSTAVMQAAVSGHQSVFDLLVSNQADLTLVNTDGNSLLHLACRGGNTAIVQHVLSPSNINSTGRYGWTAAMKAAVNGHQSVFDLLVSNQADLTLVDTDGNSLLHLACQGGNTAIVQHVLSPSNINSRGMHGHTPVMMAAVTGHQSVFDLLVSNQADLTLMDTYGDSLLHLACGGGGNTAIVKHVLSPSNINSTGRYGWTAAMKAAVNGHQSVFDLLMSNQADLTLVDTYGDSLLHLACRGGNTAIVQHVLSPSNINSRGRYGWTAAMNAADYGHQSVFDLLVSNQADLTLVDTYGDSLLHLACRGGNTAIVQHVLSPSNINSRGRHGWTAVIQAAVSGHQSVFDLLVSNQADLTLVDTYGDSLLHLACQGGNTAIVQHVLSPSNINSTGRYGWTAAMKAAVNGHQSVFDLLVCNQADLTLVDTDGDSLLHLACQGGNTAIVQHVLSPSNINSRGSEGYTPVMKAVFHGHQDVVDLLVQHKADLTLLTDSNEDIECVAQMGGHPTLAKYLQTVKHPH